MQINSRVNWSGFRTLSGILFGIAMLLTNVVWCQENYIHYNKEILTAEKLYFTGKHKESLEKYQDIFSRYKKPFAIHCFVATQMAAARNDTSLFFDFLGKAASNGVPWSTLTKSVHVRRMLKDGHTRRALDIQEEGWKKYLNSINKVLRDSIDYLVKRDNNDRKNWKPIKDSNRIYHYYNVKVLDENLHILNRITKRVGFPGQHKIGLRENDDPWILRSFGSTLLYHHFCGLSLMKEDLLKAVEDGELLPAEYALIYEWAYSSYYQSKGQFRGSNNIFHFTTKCDYPKQDKFYNNFLSPFFYSKDTLLVNKCRGEIGMQSLEHEQIKKMFERNNQIIFRSGMFNFY